MCILVYQTKGKIKFQNDVTTQTWISETWPSILKCRFSHKTLFSEDKKDKKAGYPVITWHILLLLDLKPSSKQVFNILPHLDIYHHVREFLNNLGYSVLPYLDTHHYVRELKNLDILFCLTCTYITKYEFLSNLGYSVLPYLDIHHHAKHFLSNLATLFCLTCTYITMSESSLAIWLLCFLGFCGWESSTSVQSTSAVWPL